MPLPKDFKLSENIGFVEEGKVIDYTPNTSKTITYKNGQSYDKNPRASYVDIEVEITSGKNKGTKFVHENVNTGIYKGNRGKSQFYIWLQMLGVSEEKLEELSGQQKPSINIMQTVGKKFMGVRTNQEGENYLDLRDPEHIVKKEGTEEVVLTEEDEGALEDLFT
jgi:hypothetical protein